MKSLKRSLIIALAPLLAWGQTSWQSSIVKFGNDGKLVYVSDANLNRIVDFSWAGYKNSNEPLPNITNVISTLTAIQK
jgi:hypothetical protein